ncbi:hypothetical protein HN51_055343 [Arachis hypogaea]|uniref:Defensin-like protein n=1 Tax=Arachis hypogaea TaxID=3818 RepID=A0A6B9VBF0_ARAHY|nr:uncharacterized protein DS421_19g657980 [Arachis hypogaea]
MAKLTMANLFALSLLLSVRIERCEGTICRRYEVLIENCESGICYNECTKAAKVSQVLESSRCLRSGVCLCEYFCT